VLIAGSVVVLLAMTLGGWTLKQNTDREVAAQSKRLNDSANAADRARAAAKPRFYPIADEDALKIGHESSHPFRFEQVSGNCKVLGNVQGIDGGNKDVEVFLFTRAQFVEWKTQPDKVNALQALPKSASHVLDFQLYGTSGTYYLVVSNAFSTYTAKVVRIKAQLRCVAGPSPAIME
jgi:hypothetical protein